MPTWYSSDGPIAATLVQTPLQKLPSLQVHYRNGSQSTQAAQPSTLDSVRCLTQDGQPSPAGAGSRTAPGAAPSPCTLSDLPRATAVVWTAAPTPVPLG